MTVSMNSSAYNQYSAPQSKTSYSYTPPQDQQQQAAQSQGEAKAKPEVSATESFTYGVLGMDHPSQVQEIDDDTYTAGQVAKAALSIGGLLLAVV
ncbi:hypothetical protein [Ferrimonas aestuarii]|uniref:hypothetical protein n=1 Tax=Ferrimonas aestuarii TaxID=2569539 RepID=UPI00197AB4B0|nr:hypothetical protein [Ferrimonas aestuarii]